MCVQKKEERSKKKEAGSRKQGKKGVKADKKANKAKRGNSCLQTNAARRVLALFAQRIHNDGAHEQADGDAYGNLYH